MTLDRRRFMQLIGVGTAAAVGLPGLTLGEALAAASVDPAGTFSLGVASGDPLPNGVVLWTRLAPDPLAPDGHGGMPAQPVPVRWEVSRDESFRQVVRRGVEQAEPASGHSVHAEVTGLAPGNSYYYRFVADGETSPVGRTRTAPAPGAKLDSLRFAFASCQSWAGGSFAAYRTMAEEDLDLVVHLGDYIYERGDTRTLTDFRLLYALYKTSPDLRAAHAAFPFVVVFDDHEVDNDWAGDVSQNNEPVESFRALRAAAFQAYYEHLPLRRAQLPQGPDMRIHRRLTYGRLAEFNVLDTRQYRDDQVGTGFPGGPRDPRTLDPARTMAGDAQERWLLDGLARSQAQWNVVAQQTIMAQFDYDPGPAESINKDQWDGYVPARERILRTLGEGGPSNPVVLTGDWHSSWVNDLKLDFDDPASATVATEFVGTSISSGCGWRDDVEAALGANPHVRFFDGTYRGYVRCEVTPDSWRSDYRVVSSATDPTGPAATLSAWRVLDGRPGAVPVDGLHVTGVEIPVLEAGRPGAVTVSLVNQTDGDVEAEVTVSAPAGWVATPVRVALPAGGSSSVQAPVTPPGPEPSTADLDVRVLAEGTEVFGPPRVSNAVAVPATDDAVVSLDAGAVTSPVQPGFARLSSADTWSVERGYGWVGPPLPSSRDRGGPDALRRDFALGRGPATSLRLGVPAGQHRAWLLTGDSSFASGNTIVSIDGRVVAQSGPQEIPAGRFVWVEVPLDGGSDGRPVDLALTGELRDGFWRVVSLSLTR